MGREESDANFGWDFIPKSSLVPTFWWVCVKIIAVGRTGLRRAHAVEPGPVGALRVGELVLAGRGFDGCAEEGPIGPGHGEVGGAPHGEAQTAVVGETELECASRQLGCSLQTKIHGLGQSGEGQVVSVAVTAGTGAHQPVMIGGPGYQID